MNFYGPRSLVVLLALTPILASAEKDVDKFPPDECLPAIQIAADALKAANESKSTGHIEACFKNELRSESSTYGYPCVKRELYYRKWGLFRRYINDCGATFESGLRTQQSNLDSLLKAYDELGRKKYNESVATLKGKEVTVCDVGPEMKESFRNILKSLYPINGMKDLPDGGQKSFGGGFQESSSILDAQVYQFRKLVGKTPEKQANGQVTVACKDSSANVNKIVPLYEKAADKCRDRFYRALKLQRSLEGQLDYFDKGYCSKNAKSKDSSAGKDGDANDPVPGEGSEVPAQ